MAAVRALSLPRLARRPTAPELLVHVACVVWAGFAIKAAADDVAAWPLVGAGPGLLLGIVAAAWRGTVPAWMRVAVAWTLAVAVVLLGAAATAAQPLIAFGPAVLAVAAAVATRFPVACYAAAFGLAGAWSSLEIYTGAPISYIVDFFLAGLWTSVLWGWLTGVRRPRLPMALGMAVVGAYLAYTLVGVLAAEPMIRGVFAFRVCMWYFAAVVLVPLVLQGEDRRRRAFEAVLVVGSVIAAYAMLRWAIGPGAEEQESAEAVGRGFSETAEGELRLFGALQRPQQLGVWCSVLVPFGMVALLSPIGVRWRALGGLLMAMAGLALFATDTRTAMAGVAAGVVSVLVLVGLARGLAGGRGPAVVVGVLLTVIGGGAVAATRLDASDSTKQRFEGLLNPFEDLSFQERQLKWETILDEVDGRPFGFGVGASGEAQKRYGRFVSSTDISPDSTYVKTVYDLGIVGATLFVAALLALLASLVMRVVRSRGPTTALLSAASAGALVALAVSLATGEYAEGLQALPPWLLVGLGFAPGADQD